MGLNVVSYCLAKKYANKVSSGIAGSSYNPSTATMTVNLNDGSSYDVKFEDGITTEDRKVLDNISYNDADTTLEVNGNKVLTKSDEVPEDIDFSGMF